jgi:adenosylcobinamide-GDP ribazoletransferase
MNLNSLGHAIQFLTRLPGVRIAAFDPEDLSRSAMWFPVVGLIIGLALVLAVWAGAHVSVWVAALLGLVTWVWITGGLHIDGLSDVADALGAAHRSPERLLEVMRDPHVGAFGVMAIGVQLIAKLVLVAEIAHSGALGSLLLIPAWARLGPLVWSLMVPPLASGSGERFAWRIDPSMTVIEAAALGLLSLWLQPVLLAALAIIPAIALYWRYRLGGITGDCLGASVEVTETLLLLIVVVAAH